MTRRLPLLLLLGAALAAPAGATSVRSLGVRELAREAALVFEGRALASEARATRGGGIRTCVRFEVVEVLKGPPQPGPLELCFAGGALGGRRLRIAGMRPPEPGERGVYFVARQGGGRVHPLLGWDQGRFPIREAEQPIVTTADGAPVLALEPAEEGRETGPSSGIARGVRTGGAGLAPAAFKARVRELAAEPAR
jgi:hypothetical protein